MRTYRLGVFETNSSSSHSLILNGDVWNSNDEYRCRSLNSYKILQNELVLTGGEYGWEWSRLNTAWSKANYIATWLTVFKPNDSHLMNVLIEAIKEEINTEVRVDISSDWSSSNYSYVDHEAEDLFNDSDLSNVDYVRDFLFDIRNIIVTGNDNSYDPCGIRDPYGTTYDWKLTFPDLETYRHLYDEYTTKLEWYFTELPTDDELTNSISRILNPYNYNKNGSPYVEDDMYMYSHGRGWDENLYTVPYRYLAKKMNLKLLDRESSIFRLYKADSANGYKLIEDDYIEIKFKLEEGHYELY